MKIIITGDIHGRFGILNQLINKQNPDIIIVCGDFGYWPELINISDPHERHYTYKREQEFDISAIKNGNTKVFWAPGNHEDWNDIDKHFYRNSIAPMEMEPKSNVFFCPIGSIATIDNKNFLFVGGADSQDKAYRQPGVTWFPQENLTQQDLDFINANIKGIKIDCVISHTCPSIFTPRLEYPEKFSDPNRRILSEIYYKYKPTKWFCGHWHYHQIDRYENTKWCMLDYTDGYGRWWIEYDKI